MEYRGSGSHHSLASCFFAFVCLIAALAQCGRSQGQESAPREQKSQQLTADEAIKRAIQATRDVESQLQSAIGEAVFERHKWEGDEKEPQLWTKCKVKMHFDRGKYRLQFAYEKMLARTVYHDPDGGKTEKVVDWKPDDLIIVFDGKEANAVKFSQRIRPYGCEGYIYSELENACVEVAQLRWGKLAELWKQRFELGPTVANLGRDAMQIEQRPTNKWLLTFAVKNSPNVRVEMDIDTERNFHIVEERVFSPGRNEPAARYTANWKHDAPTKVWYIDSVEEEHRFFGGQHPPTRERLRFESFKVNVPVDPKLFELESIEYPVMMRFLDRRPGQ
jgi:hypothetical protein